jgi:hypothetical protein
MTSWQIALAVVAFLIFDMTILTLVLRIAAQGWHAIADACPPRPEREPSLRRNFQGVSINALNLGGCVHIAIDADHLHVQPALVARWLGIRPASIPRAALTVEGTFLSTVRWKVKSVPGTTLRLPSWCVRAPNAGMSADPAE